MNVANFNADAPRVRSSRFFEIQQTLKQLALSDGVCPTLYPILNTKMGDLGSDIAILLAKKSRRSATQIAIELVDKLKRLGFHEAHSVDKYVNFTLNPESLVEIAAIDCKQFVVEDCCDIMISTDSLEVPKHLPTLTCGVLHYLLLRQLMADKSKIRFYFGSDLLNFEELDHFLLQVIERN